MLPGLLTLVGAPLLRGMVASLRLEVLGRPVAREYAVRGRKIGIGAFWHRHLIPVGGYFSRLNAVVMISRSRDGELIARALRRTTLSTVRGSSSSGGREALDELIAAVRAGRPGAFAVDGPKGPARSVKPGIVIAARATGAPIVPLSFAARRAIVLRNWDGTVIPRPGTRAVLAFGEPIPVAADAGPEECERIRADLEARLTAMERECERRVGTPR